MRTIIDSLFAGACIAIGAGKGPWYVGGIGAAMLALTLVRILREHRRPPLAILDKQGVLFALECKLSLCDIVIRHSQADEDPEHMQKNLIVERVRIQEAIRFIEEHGHGIPVKW